MWIFKAFRAIATFLSLYVFYKGLQMHSPKVALPYLIPGVFWGGYYYYFVREILKERRVPMEERVWYILFMLVGITGMLAALALSNTGTQFLIGIILSIFALVLLVMVEERIENAVRALRNRNPVLLPAIFISTGALFYIAMPSLLGLTYAVTFIAIGVTVYEWNLEKIQDNT